MTGTDPMGELRAVLDDMTGYLIEANRRVPGGNKDWGRCIERAIALLERADAAGARDETAAVVRRALVDWCSTYGTECGDPTRAGEAQLIDEWLPGWLDAPRAGGAGDDG